MVGDIGQTSVALYLSIPVVPPPPLFNFKDHEIIPASVEFKHWTFPFIGVKPIQAPIQYKTTKTRLELTRRRTNIRLPCFIQSCVVVVLFIHKTLELPAPPHHLLFHNKKRSTCTNYSPSREKKPHRSPHRHPILLLLRVFGIHRRQSFSKT